MALSVYTNLSSLNTQRWLHGSALATTKATRRLSSGLRINEAADDISGMAIASGMRTRVRSDAAAGRNIQDGLSIVGQADAAIGEQIALLHQIRERAIQAASDTNNNANRQALDTEAVNLVNEVDRIAQTTRFNGFGLLDGSFSGKSFRIGSGATNDENLELSIASTRADKIGAAKTGADTYTLDIYQNGAGDYCMPGGWDAGEVKITTNGVTTDVPPPAGDMAKDYAAAINGVSGTTGVRATATTIARFGHEQSTQATVEGDVKINDVTIPAFQNASASDSGPGSAVAAINSKSAETGVTATLGGDNKITLTAADGRHIYCFSTDAGSLATGMHTSLAGFGWYGGLSLTGNAAFTVTDTSADFSWDYAALWLTGTSASATLTAQGADSHLADLRLATRDDALTAIRIVDQALADLGTQRSRLGALSNRMSSSQSVLNISTEMTSAAEARIMDADYAAETTALSRAQILQQAGVAVLSQANMAPQLVLSLIRGN